MTKRLIVLSIIATLAVISPVKASAAEPELLKMRATAYCLDGKCANGEPVRKGVCATGNKALIGKTVIVYQRLPNGTVGELIGIYEITDTGCSKYVIDVWRPKEECQRFMDRVYEDGCQGKVFIQLIEAEG